MAGTVLIIESDAFNRKLFNDLLQANGFDTVLSDGRDVISLARENRPDLILMEIQLSREPDLELAKDLKADRALDGIPIVALTAFALADDEKRLLESGCDGYIAKPISIDGFLDTVTAFIS